MNRSTTSSSFTKGLTLFGLLISVTFSAVGQPGGTGGYLVTSENNELVASIKIDQEQTVLAFSQEEYFGVSKKAEKRKYYTTEDQMAFAVKYVDGIFKLRDENDDLLWKVKVYDDYLKISDNEEMDKPFRIAFSDSGKLKVKVNGEEKYVIRFDQSAPRSKAGDYYLVNFKGSLATGVMLIEDISMKQRLLLAAEVLRLGK